MKRWLVGEVLTPGSCHDADVVHQKPNMYCYFVEQKKKTALLFDFYSSSSEASSSVESSTGACKIKSAEE
jgi:hypothetical protein